VDEGHSGDELVAQFARWAADQRAAEAVDRRTRERFLRDQVIGSATWIGLMVDLAERSALVSLRVSSQRLRGRVVGVGRDFCVLDQPSGRAALVALGALTVVAPEEAPPSRVGAPGGSRESGLQLSLAAALAALAEERSQLALVLAGGHQVEGTLIGAGEDVLTLKTDGQAQRLAHVPLAAVWICEVR
jgi:hypothetical protein